MWAKMCSALADHHALDFSPAYGAGLTLAAIDPEMVLEITAAVDPIYTGPVTTDAFLQHLPDSRPKIPGLFNCDRIRHRQRVKPGHVQRFVRINITQPGKEGLVKQKGFELPVPGVQGSMQAYRCKFIGERLRPKVLEDYAGLLHQPDPSKLARVRKNELHVIRQLQDETVVPGWLVTTQDNQQVPAHAQVNDEMRTRKFYVKEFGPPEDILDLLTTNDLFELRRRGVDQGAIPAQIGR